MVLKIKKKLLKFWKSKTNKLKDLRNEKDLETLAPQLVRKYKNDPRTLKLSNAVKKILGKETDVKGAVRDLKQRAVQFVEEEDQRLEDEAQQRAEEAQQRAEEAQRRAEEEAQQRAEQQAI